GVGLRRLLGLVALVGLLCRHDASPGKLRSVSLPQCPLPGGDRTVTSAFPRASSAVPAEFTGFFDVRGWRSMPESHSGGLERCASRGGTKRVRGLASIQASNCSFVRSSSKPSALVTPCRAPWAQIIVVSGHSCFSSH